MSKTVFRPNEINQQAGEVLLKLTHEFAVPEEPVEEVSPVYEGPTVEELEQQANEYRSKWEVQKQKMLDEAQNSADEIVKKAEETAFNQVKIQTDKAQEIKAEAEQNAQSIIQKAQEQAQEIIQKAQQEQTEIRSKSRKEGFQEGKEEGFTNGAEEADRLVERMHNILDAVMTRREEILNETEQQIIELVILMSRKVVKVISENQKNVLMNNILAALKKVKGRGNVTLRVNIQDLKMTTEHTKLFLQKIENVKNIAVLEDSSVEKGGCIVETDFGAIDARISSQLNELEQKILEVAPVKTIPKTAAVNPDR